MPAALAAQTAAPPALTDANIVAIFDQANTADIETGNLAAMKGASPDVKNLGKMFAEGHTTVRQQGRDLAKKLGITPVLPKGDQGSAQAKAALSALNTTSGAAFDKAYLDHEIAFHQAVIDAVTKTLLPATQNPELKKFIESVAPAFVGHLEQAKAVRQKVVS
jgi:putative membrane protein